MADNIASAFILAAASGLPVRIAASNVSGVFTLGTESSGLVAITIPGVVQADNQALPAPLKAKDNGDGTYSLVTSPA